MELEDGLNTTVPKSAFVTNIRGGYDEGDLAFHDYRNEDSQGKIMKVVTVEQSRRLQH